MAEFSADRTPSLMPVRLSERKGNVGAEAAQKAASGRGKGSRLGRVKPPAQAPAQAPVGRPAPDQGAIQQQGSDLRYLDMGMQHFNMKGLGRDVPYAVWSTLTGNYRAYAQPGRPPFDIFEDG
jgi:hypothetical protein